MVLEPLRLPFTTRVVKRIEYIKSIVYSDRMMLEMEGGDEQLVIAMCSLRERNGMLRWVAYQIDRLRRSFPAGI
jgi:hypothetical protein